MQFSHYKRRRTPSVIIVSLIDVLLVVLIFLMATTAFKKEQASLKLALPESKISKAGAAETKPPLVITITTNVPYLFLGSTPVTIERIQAELDAGAKANPNLRVAIRADKRAPFGEVIKVIDAAKLAQVGSIDAYTEKVEQ
jgi:biopolymer transport protein ExbD